MLILIGGHSRSVGKSTILAAVRDALAPLPWKAIKISRHRHVATAAPLRMDRGEGQILLRAPESGLGEAARFIAQFPCALVESNRLIELVQPDLALFVARQTIADWKDSATAFLARSDAAIVVGPGELPIAFPGPSFRLSFGQHMSPELVAFLHAHPRLQRGCITSDACGTSTLYHLSGTCPC
jgi:hypothetical protein